MDFLKTDFGKMIVFMLLGGIFLVLVLGFSKSPKAMPSVAGAHSMPHSTSSSPRPSSSASSGEEYSPAESSI